MAIIRFIKSTWRFLKNLFITPNLFETAWVGKGIPGYHASASRSFGLSVLAIVIAIIVSSAFPDLGRTKIPDMVYWGLCGLTFIAAVIIDFATWKSSSRKIQWFLCHAIFAFLSGYVIAYVFLIAIAIIFAVWFFKLCVKWAFRVDIHPTSWIPSGASSAVSTWFDSSKTDSSASSQGASGAVESQDMFNDELKQRQAWGPDKNLVHDESQDSIYGNTYVDKDSGKEYRVVETDAFGHPTKVEEKW